MTEIPHPSNVTDHDVQRIHYYRQIAEQLARIGDVVEGSARSKVPQGANMVDRDQLQTYTLRQIAVQLARTADALEAEAAPSARSPSPARKRRSG
jgi:hypothetical protein